MYKKILAVLVVNLAIIVSVTGTVDAAASYGWTKTFGAKEAGGLAGIDYGRAVTTDRSGNVFVAGSFESQNMDFNPDPAAQDFHTSGYVDSFLTKFNADGSYGWTKHFDNSRWDEADAVATDTSGNIFITGRFQCDNNGPDAIAINFNTDGGSDLFTSSNIGLDQYVTKFNSDGTYAWTRTIFRAGSDEAKSIATDSKGNVYIGGYQPEGSNYNEVMYKYSKTGTLLWSKTLASMSHITTKSNSIAVDSHDNVYLSGSFTGTKNFNPDGNDELTATSDKFTYLSKYTNDGTYVWTKLLAGGERAITIDSHDNIFITGAFAKETNFSLTGTDTRTNVGGADFYLTKLDENGNYKWTKTAGGDENDYSYGLSTDPFGNIYLSGQFRGTANFNPDGSDIHSRPDSFSLFYMRINADGSFAWAKDIGGIDKKTSVTSISLQPDNKGNLYVNGSFKDRSMDGVDFNPFGGTDIHYNAETKAYYGDTDTNPYDDVFLTKITNIYPVVEPQNLGSLIQSHILDADSETSTQNIQVTDDVLIDVPAAHDIIHQIHLPKDTVITSSTGNNIDPSQLTASAPSTNTITNTGSNVAGAIQWGIAGSTLEFSQAITLTIFVGQEFDGTTLTAVRSVTTDGGWTTEGIVGTSTCVVTGGWCTFEATKASYYAVLEPNQPVPVPNPGPVNSTTDTPVCGDNKPGSIPDLFQINTKRISAQLFFSPVVNNNSYYMISYGLKEGDERFGVTISPQNNTGVLNYTINKLLPNTNYFFKIRGGNGCKPGDWSSTIKAKTTIGKNATQKFYKYTKQKAVAGAKTKAH